MRNRKIKPKIIIYHANLENPKKRFVQLYRLYNSLCPPNHPPNILYLQPFHKPTKEQWYSTRPVGHATLETTVKRMCSKAGMVRYYTNHHSLRATAVTRLHHHNIEEQQIMERTGHGSAEAVRSYKRTSSIQQERVSGILNNEKGHCNASMTAESVYVQTNQNEQMNHLSLECTSSNSIPVFNIFNCSTASIHFSKQ